MNHYCRVVIGVTVTCDYMLFLHFKQGFDRVDHGIMCMVLKSYCSPPKLMITIQLSILSEYFMYVETFEIALVSHLE